MGIQDHSPQRDEDERALTVILDQLNGGSAGAFSRLVDEVYVDLRRIAARRLNNHFHGGEHALTIQPTAMANDAIMELRDQRAQWQNSDQFFAIATRLIERMISQYKRQRSAQKRGSGKRGASLDALVAASGDPANDEGGSSDFEHITAALQKLHEAYPRKAEVVTLHVVCGHPLSKVKEMVGVEQTTVERDWAFAKKWLARELKEEA